MKRKIKKRLLLFSAISMIAISSLSVVSCEESDLLGCDRCSDDAPYSPADGGACYETQSACESAEGTDCIICN